MTAFAVMEDDTVLCADCVHEICDGREPAMAATIVHAWLATRALQVCSRCAINDRDDSEEDGS